MTHPTPPTASVHLVGSPTNETLVGFGKASGAINENWENYSSSQKEDRGLGLWK